MRISRNTLETTLVRINAALGRPAEMFSSKVGEPTRFSVGHYNLDKNSTGWQLEEQMSESGGTIAHTGRLKTADMALFLRAFLQGIVSYKGNVS
jgi:hypothetical protein